MRKPGSRGPETLRNLRSAAIQLLAERSYEGMNLRLLASKLKLQAGSLYNYIESKQQLLFWLMKESTEKLLVQFDESIAPSDDPAEQMLKFVGFHVGYHIANRKEASVLLTEMRSLTPQNYRAIKHLQRLYTDKIQAIIERGSTRGDFTVNDSRIATFVLLQMLTAVARWYTPRGRLTVDELIGVYTDLTFAMLRAKDGAAPMAHLNGVMAEHNGHAAAVDPITHSFDVGSHVLQVSIASHPKNGESKDDERISLAPRPTI